MAWRILAVLAGFLAVAIWLAPLRFVVGFANLEPAGISTGAIDGSIWNGRLEDVSIRGASLGDVNVAAESLSLLTGRPAFAFRANGPITEGVVSGGGGGAAFTNLRGQFALTQLDSRAPSGAVATIIGANISLGANACLSASGQTRIVGMQSAGLPDMSGPLSCEEGRFRLALTPDADQPGPAIDLFLDISSPGEPRILARSDDIGVQAALPDYGIEVIAP